MKHDEYCERRAWVGWGSDDCGCGSRAYQKDPIEAPVNPMTMFEDATVNDGWASAADWYYRLIEARINYYGDPGRM